MDLTTSGSASVLKPAAALTDSEGTAPAGESAPPTLPESPLVVIEPGRATGLAAARELWHYRELLYFLIWRDVKVRYKQTALGVAWAVIQPLLTMFVFTLFFGLLVRVPSDGVALPGLRLRRRCCRGRSSRARSPPAATAWSAART